MTNQAHAAGDAFDSFYDSPVPVRETQGLDPHGLDPDGLDPAATPRRQPGATIAIVGTRGGCGATTIAVGLAHAAHRTGKRVCLVDAASDGLAVSSSLGLAASGGRTWSGLAGTQEQIPAQQLRQHLGRPDQPALLLGPMRHVSAKDQELILNSCRNAFDAVIVDYGQATKSFVPLTEPSLLLPVTTLQRAPLIRCRQMTRASPTPDGSPVVVNRHGAMSLSDAAAYLRPHSLFPIPMSNRIQDAADFGRLGTALSSGRAGRRMVALLKLIDICLANS